MNLSSRLFENSQVHTLVDKSPLVNSCPYRISPQFHIDHREPSQILPIPVTTQIRHITEPDSIFLVIAFCNSNPFTTNFSIDFLSHLIANNYPNANTTSTRQLYQAYSKHHCEIHNLLKFYTNSSVQKRLVLSLEDTLVKCEFQEEACHISEFKWFFDWNFGNCYMFDTSLQTIVEVNLVWSCFLAWKR